jgi:hypothetical protein
MGGVMLKIAIPALILLALLMCPIFVNADNPQPVGMTSWNANGTVGSSITITIDPPLREFPELTQSDLAKAEIVLAVGNKLYQAECLRGQTIKMRVYMRSGLAWNKDFEPATIYVRNFYQSNQEILGYEPY